MGWLQARRVALVGGKALVAFGGGPAVVAAESHPVELFPGVLTDVAHPQVAGLAVERPPVGVAKTPRENLGPAAAVRERVVRRDAVGLWCPREDVEPKDRP